MSLHDQRFALQNEAVKELTRSLEQPPFTPADLREWRKIWAPAFALDSPDAIEQDDIIGPRELAASNIWGVDSSWNKVPCTHQDRVLWKRCLFPRIIQCIAQNSWVATAVTTAATVTAEHSPIEEVRFAVLCQWVVYCKAKGVQLWVLHDGLDDVIEAAVSRAVLQLQSSVFAAWEQQQIRERYWLTIKENRREIELQRREAREQIAQARREGLMSRILRSTVLRMNTATEDGDLAPERDAENAPAAAAAQT